MRYRLFILSLLLAALFSGTAHAQMSTLRFRGFEVKSIVPTGFRSVKATVELLMVNPGTRPFDMKDIQVVIYRNGAPYVTGECPSIPVDSGESAVSAVGTFKLCEGVTLWSVLRTMLSFHLEEFAADVSLSALGDSGQEQPFMLKGFSVQNAVRSRSKK